MVYISLFICAITLATIGLHAEEEDSLFDLSAAQVGKYNILATQGDAKAQHKMAMLFLYGL